MTDGASDLALGANPEWKRAASCRPIRSWPLGRRSGCFHSRALSSAQVECIVPTDNDLPESPRDKKEARQAKIRPVVRSGLPCNLRSLPSGPTRGRTVDAALRQEIAKPAARCSVWSGPYGEEFAPDKYASAAMRQSCSRLSRAVPCEGMCWEQSPLKRTIATSRSEATTPRRIQNTKAPWQLSTIRW